METFQLIQLSARLAPYVKHYWVLEMDAAEAVAVPQRIIPTGSVELIFHLADALQCDAESVGQNGLQPRAFVGGMSTRYVDLLPTGSVRMLVATFRPYAANAFFRIPASELSGLSVALDEMDDPDLRALSDRLLCTIDIPACLQLLDAFLLRRLAPLSPHSFRRVSAAVRAISEQPHSMTLASLANVTCLSKRQLQRVFAEHVGLSPKDFQRIVRFQRALHTLESEPSLNLSQLAYQCGFYDQPHLISEFKTFSGYTPTEYVAVCAPHSDYFS